MKTVFVAMSGGIDSSFAAYLLKKQGFKVIGITFQLLPDSLKNVRNPKACCSLDTIHRAKRVADTLSIPHYVINLKDEFEEHVIQRFIDGYKKGETPNPCILCNRYIKFSSFFTKVLSMGGEKIATGHYARIEETSGTYQLKKGIDRTKDQSYFLYPIKTQLLKSILFPLGRLRKTEVKAMAELVGWKKDGVRESQDICFIPEGDYRGFLSNFVGLRKGPVFSIDGKRLGEHDGIHLYTVGQRRGLNIPYGEPLYVVEIRPHDNCVIIGPKEFLKKRRLTATEANLLHPSSTSVTGKVRYRQEEQPCRYTTEGALLQVEFLQPIDAITPGQSVVLYTNDTVIGGGVITGSTI
ncbi:MAG: tRNA-specific 2-thiouridylase MnmA [Syntrophorhabdus sp. PtaU1.Bin002]|nr:MAG: tRNA-specific 2-thiouridylase MnmA [Syntrophorhabdus sp. PtaB.Bin006]OPY73830.1 MAG: tRNA-specific 2-thiouridylase MnmA [Syntrophorhabdus sp. PtaU1.Bin002]